MLFTIYVSNTIISDHQQSRAGGMGMAPRRGRDHALLVVADL